jgi:uncharacterized protein
MRTSKQSVENFLAQKTIAIVGVSRNERKFGTAAYKELKVKGYKVYPVNPNMNEVNGEKCYSNLHDLPEKPGGVFISVKADETEKVVKEAAGLNINNIWMQPGSESIEAIEYCKKNNINVVHNECILMFAEPLVFGHKAHRWIKGIFGKLPN